MGFMTVGCPPRVQRFGGGGYLRVVPDVKPDREWFGLAESVLGSGFKEGSVSSAIRTFPTGATRATDLGKHDPEGYLSPLAIERYCEYMTTHRVQVNGSLRASDNWQKGIPLEEYVKSLLRHTLDFWRAHRGWAPADLMEDAACAILFNISGWLHERVKARLRGAP